MAAAGGRALRAAIGRRQQELALALAATALCAASAAPLVHLVAGEAAAWLGRAAPSVAAGALPLLLRSLALATAVTLLALGLGVPLGALVGRADVRGLWPTSLLHAFPVFLPPFLLALGWFQIFGVSGLLGSEATSSALFSVPISIRAAREPSPTARRLAYPRERGARFASSRREPPSRRT